MINLSVEDILNLHSKIQGNEPTGTIFPTGVGSALSSYLYYQDIKLQIISIFYGLVKNHCFSDGNKRTAALVLFYLAEANNLPILLDDAKMKNLILKLASSDVPKQDLAKQIFG